MARFGNVAEINEPSESKVFLSDWKKKLERPLSSKKVLFVGVGNPLRGDDGVSVFIAGERPGNLLSYELQGIETVIFLDACSFRGRRGDGGWRALGSGTKEEKSLL